MIFCYHRDTLSINRIEIVCAINLLKIFEPKTHFKLKKDEIILTLTLDSSASIAFIS